MDNQEPRKPEDQARFDSREQKSSGNWTEEFTRQQEAQKNQGNPSGYDHYQESDPNQSNQGQGQGQYAEADLNQPNQGQGQYEDTESYQTSQDQYQQADPYQSGQDQYQSQYQQAGPEQPGQGQYQSQYQQAGPEQQAGPYQTGENQYQGTNPGPRYQDNPQGYGGFFGTLGGWAHSLYESIGPLYQQLSANPNALWILLAIGWAVDVLISAVRDSYFSFGLGTILSSLVRVAVSFLIYWLVMKLWAAISSLPRPEQQNREFAALYLIANRIFSIFNNGIIVFILSLVVLFFLATLDLPNLAIKFQNNRPLIEGKEFGKHYLISLIPQIVISIISFIIGLIIAFIVGILGLGFLSGLPW